MTQKEGQQFLTFCIRIGFIFFSSYLLYGAYFVWTSNKWPAFMPPQLDVLGMLFNSLGNKVGVYLNVIFLSVLGLLFLSLALLPKRGKKSEPE